MTGSAHEDALSHRQTGWQGRLKCLLDVVVSLGVLVVAWPIMLLIAVFLLAAQGEPVLFRQRRVGRSGRVFEMYKFRTMQIAEVLDVEGMRHRPTPLGRFLRLSGLDELPQLFNVLRGDMSLIGPRPERPELIEQFRQVIPQYMLRHHVKAGMTGLAQVRGWRGNTSLRKRIQYDLYYIRNWSIWLDAYVLGLTAFRGFVHPCAY